MKEMIKKILDEIPENEIRKYIEEIDAPVKTLLVEKAAIAKAKKEVEKKLEY